MGVKYLNDGEVGWRLVVTRRNKNCARREER